MHAGHMLNELNARRPHVLIGGASASEKRVLWRGSIFYIYREHVLQRTHSMENAFYREHIPWGIHSIENTFSEKSSLERVLLGHTFCALRITPVHVQVLAHFFYQSLL